MKKGHYCSQFRMSMCTEIIEMFAEGKTRSEFCARHNIAQDTFSQWLDKHQLFEDAYITAHEHALAYYDKLAREHLVEEKDGPKLNTRLYELMMRNRFNMPQNRIVKLQGMAQRSAQDKLNSICEAVEKGQLSADEAQKLASIIDSTIKAQEHEELKKRVEAIEQANKIGLDDEGFKEVQDDS